MAEQPARLLLQLLWHCKGDETLQWHFINTVKEAVFLQHGSTKLLTSLSMEQQTAMWTAIIAGPHSPKLAGHLSLPTARAAFPCLSLPPTGRLFVRACRPRRLA